MGKRLWDLGLVLLAGACAFGAGGLWLAVTGTLLLEALPALQAFGVGFLLGQVWNPVQGQYGIGPPVWGTLVTTGLALALAVPLGLGVAIGLAESWPWLPSRWRVFGAALVDLLAAIPSVVYGLWGIFVLIPALRLWQKGQPQLFGETVIGPSVGVASLVLAIMLVPTIATVARSSLQQVPQEYRWAAAALGATRWEQLLGIVLPAARVGIGGGILLALARALGETMAVTMLIGNAHRISGSLWQPGSTIPSLLANQFAEAQGMQVAALMYAALVLLGVTVAMHLLARGVIPAGIDSGRENPLG
ncbi:MAG: phosphate ABC transporter permease subunit PstC [Gloeomargarita sp. SKYBB_i_bin120]|nr:phosphate ABC transporter permease subunit PstC [Gloeomargarita sp. SKYG98]MCS7291622.1 phosphate ABC transporter permease subunit PstC [Gloeomargarita sp. SKYB120]MDW8177181.1 phosphate ABC transporter permease subunit PstC [Gloeomargarita sp. SKYBB_i_bin120]